LDTTLLVPNQSQTVGYSGYISVAYYEDEGPFAVMSCATATTCVVVRQASMANGLGPRQPEAFSGTVGSWATTLLPVTQARSPGHLAGVSCTAVSECEAVGWNVSPTGLDQPFVSALSSGGWTSESLPVLGADSSRLRDVSCASPSFCLAVGGFITEGPATVPNGFLLESLSDGRWTAKHMSLGGFFGSLSSVACPAVRWCVAVGADVVGTYRVTLTGKTWSLTNISPKDSWPDGPSPQVACSAVGRCVIVEVSVVRGHARVVVETLSGGRWRISPLGLGAYAEQAVSGVSCVSATRCVAVGELAHDGGAVIDEYSPAGWTVHRVLLGPGYSHVVLHGVSCWGSNSCASIGTYVSGASTYAFEVSISPDGIRISAVPAVAGDEVAGDHALEDAVSSISCRPLGACVVVGTASTSLTVTPFESRLW
jgi:hypothetical protein